ncbi:hypothetical protein ACFYP4_02935 [Streptomyces sp. NPDC005551]|uniref:hypothetical protein n=1 Tax=Streptomyces sp. NPDC005551 TaxID=3364725 RepID=UPI00367CC867
MRTVVMNLSGVLRPAAHPDGVDDIGRAIYQSLVQKFRVVLLDTDARADTEHWLGVHGISGYVRAYTPPADFAPRTVAEGRLRLLAAIRASDGADLVIESDPVCAAEEIRAGYTVMLYGKPEYALDIWDPDHPKEARPWDTIVDEIERQRTMKALDSRLKETDD